MSEDHESLPSGNPLGLPFSRLDEQTILSLEVIRAKAGLSETQFTGLVLGMGASLLNEMLSVRIQGTDDPVVEINIRSSDASINTPITTRSVSLNTLLHSTKKHN